MFLCRHLFQQFLFGKTDFLREQRHFPEKSEHGVRRLEKFIRLRSGKTEHHVITVLFHCILIHGIR